MRLKDIDLDRIIPNFMENDACVKALNATLEPLVKELANKMKTLSIWDNLASLSDEELDNIAYEFDIPWYNSTYDKRKKIKIIEDNVKLMKRLGTPYTFKQILQDIFGGCELKEAGIDYDGLPHHFMIEVTNAESLDKVSYDRLGFLIGKVKRASSWLDKVTSIHSSDMIQQVAMSTQNVAIESIKMDLNGLVRF